MENANIYTLNTLKENAALWKFYQHLMYSEFTFSCVTGPKPKPRNETDEKKRKKGIKKSAYNVDLGKFMVTESDIGPPTYEGIFKNVMFTHSF